MPVISKQLFYERINKDVNCDLIHIWNADCKTAIFSPFWLLNLCKGTGKFYIPIYVIKLLLRSRRNDKKTLILNFITSELRSIVYGIILGTLLVSSICFFRKLYGRINYYSILFMPGMVAGLSLLAETKENQILNTLIFFNSAVETFLKKIGITRGLETVLFMGVSSSLMHILANRKSKIDFTYLWFYTPPLEVSVERDSSNSSCTHQETCQSHILQGFFKYVSLGYAVNVIKQFLPKFQILLKKPMTVFKILFNKSNVYFGLFIGSYVGLYKALTCYLTRTSKIKKKFHGCIAGLFSGITYAISPNIQVLDIAITTLFQMIYHFIAERLKVTNHVIQRVVVFMFCSGFLLHHRFFHTKSCSPYYSRMVDACTNDITKVILDRLMNKFFL